MTALTTRSGCATPWSACPEDLEDKFWAALNFAFEDARHTADNQDTDHITDDGAIPSAPSEVTLLPRAYSRSHKTTCSSTMPRHSIASTPDPVESHPCRSRKITGSLRLQVPSTPSIPTVTLSPVTALQRSPLSPSTAKSRWRLAGSEMFRASTPTLQLVGNFLDSIVRLSGSRSTTPAAAVAPSEGREEIITESEVLIQVVDDSNRNTFSSPLQGTQENDLLKLKIPPPPLTVQPGIPYILPSAVVASGPASCAQELDALSWMRSERQLSNVQHSLWH